METMTKFENPHNSAKAKIEGGRISFSYSDSYGKAVSTSLAVLQPQDIVKMVEKRMKRFASAGVGSRESDDSRSERKYISAHPNQTLREAWIRMDEKQAMEFAMMLSPMSHHGISDPQWLSDHTQQRSNVIGDDEQPLGK